MRVEDVVDRESLEAYLDALLVGARLELARFISVRLALRSIVSAFRLYSGRGGAPYSEGTLVSVFGYAILCDVAVKEGISVEGHFPDLIAPYERTQEHDSAAVGIQTLHFARLQLSNKLSETKHALKVLDLAVKTFDSKNFVWPALQNDLLEWQQGRRVLLSPLWPAGNSLDKVSDAFQVAKSALNENSANGGANWDFWITWYQRILDGDSTLTGNLKSIVTGISVSDWEKGPEHINPMFDEVLALYQAEDGTPNTSLDVSVPKGKPDDIERTKAAMIQHRKELPPTFDSILGYISLEIERLQGINQNRDEVDRQIATLLTIYEAIERLQTLVPSLDAMDEGDAVEAEGIIRLVFTRIKEWPRTKPGEFEDNVADLVDNSYRAAMIGGFVYAAPMLAVSAETALIAGAALFGGKKIVDSAKAAKDLIGGDK